VPAPQLHPSEAFSGTGRDRLWDLEGTIHGGGRHVFARKALIGATAAGMAVSAGFTVLTAGAAGAATVAESHTIAASEDAYVSSTRTGDNFGTADKLVVGTSAGETRTSYVKFVVPALPAGAAVAQAQLTVRVDGPTDTSRVSAYPVTGAWSETTITAGKLPVTSATAAGSVLPKSSDTFLTVDVSSAVKTAGTFSFVLKSAATNAVTRLRSTEYVATEQRPQLTLNYTVPTTAPTKAPTTAPTTAPTKAPTTAPTKAPTTAPTTGAPATCTTGALLVPTCGVLWGAAAGGFTDVPRDQALKDWETLTGRTATIYHTYHKGDEKFPTPAEIAMTDDPAHPRVLMLNWKVSYNSTWAKTAAGAQDARIDAWANYVKTTYPTKKFFLVLHHEPENDVDATAGSGMTAKDYAAMYRHVILRLRADKVTNVVNVLAYMGNEKWMAQSWWKDLYPGDDVVDWIGLDSYVSVEKGYYHYGDFGSLLDRQPTGGGPGFYAWSVTNHPSKPIMVAEWGMYHRLAYPTSKAAAFQSVVPQLAKHPQVKGIVYFDTASDDSGDRNIAVNSTPDSLTAFKQVAANPIFNVKLGN
jgi:beta-mannanase